MASLRKKPRSPYWWACFTLPDGRRIQRTTKQEKRKAAQALAEEWEKLSKDKARAKQAHQVIAEIYRSAHGDNLPMSTARNFLEGWLARRKGEVKPASYIAYSGRVKGFLSFLANAQADKEPLGNITKETITRYRDEIAARLSPGTANQTVKILRSILEDARRDGYIADNVAKDVRPLKEPESTSKRRPFTLPELRAVLAVADTEWRSMIFFGLYTGQRLADIAQLRWTNLDLTTKELKLVTGKTGRTVIIPLCEPLFAHILTLTAGDNPAAPIHPRALTHVKDGGIAAGLSRQFGELLASAGLRAATSHEAREDKTAKRVASEISFHALRHTATSLMKNAGISSAVVQDIIGHDSAEMSRHYTHIESAAKSKALESLPNLTNL